VAKIWINTCELSGDIQSAEFLKEFKKIAPRIEVLGMGGSHLEEAGMRCLYRIEELSVLGIVEVFSALPRIISLLRKIKKSLAKELPDAIILTDAPDFNFFIARMAKKMGIPVFYFIPPKVWAWRTGRIKFLKNFIKKIYSILPFEVAFYKEHNIDVEYIGNPLVALVDYEKIVHINPEKGRIGLMPGSRKTEVEYLLPEFSRCAEILKRTLPHLEFYLIRAPHFSEEYLRSHWNSSVPLYIEAPQNRYAFMRSCECIIAASGTAVLESAIAGVPTLVTYKVSPLTYAIAKRLMKVKWISLPNLIMQKEIFPECIQDEARAEKFAGIITHWLTLENTLDGIIQDCAKLRDTCGDTHGAERLALSFYEDIKNYI